MMRILLSTVPSDDNTIGNTLEFDYTGGEQVFTALEDAVYKPETWGAQHATDSTTYHGGSGGGFKGTSTTNNYFNGDAPNNNPTGGSQTTDGYGGGNLNGNNASSWLNGKFGIGGGSKVTDTVNISSGGGGASWGGSAAGDSGYIGNSLLTEKAMYCYNCQESKDISTKTISTTCTSATPTANCSKQGNGYARITLVNVS